MAKRRPKTAARQELGIEEAMKRLEEIVHLMEEGEISLDEALAYYEEGVRLLRHTHQLLRRAERKIDLLRGVDAQGNPITEPVEDRATLQADDTDTNAPGPSP